MNRKISRADLGPLQHLRNTILLCDISQQPRPLTNITKSSTLDVAGILDTPLKLALVKRKFMSVHSRILFC